MLKTFVAQCFVSLIHVQSSLGCYFFADYLDCKTVRIFAYSSKREQSNERSGTRRVRLARFARVRLVRQALRISLLVLKKKIRLFCSLRIT